MERDNLLMPDMYSDAFLGLKVSDKLKVLNIYAIANLFKIYNKQRLEEIEFDYLYSKSDQEILSIFTRLKYLFSKEKEQESSKVLNNLLNNLP